MTPEQKDLVQTTFADVVPIADTAAKLFYGKLFELDPDLKSLFKGDMEEQGRKLMQIIATAVNGLDRLDEIVPVVEDLGKRHVGYGVKAKDYNTVGTALLWTLKQGLDSSFTPEVEEAWTVVYTLLADTMKNAAAKAA
ncbi:MAG: hemin receptor [Gammaproteobacteria bacterium SG8_15]|nr:MAG: hemin receptor [Gammaproteobacteria bacterium SG8_15]